MKLNLNLHVPRPEVDGDKLRHWAVPTLLVVALVALFGLSVSTDHMMWFVRGLVAVLGVYLLITVRDFAREHKALAVCFFLVGVGGFILSRVIAPPPQPSVTVTEVVIVPTPLSSGEQWRLIVFFVLIQVGIAALLGLVGSRLGALGEFCVAGISSAALGAGSVWYFEQPDLLGLFMLGLAFGIVPALISFAKLVLSGRGKVLKFLMQFLAQLASPIVLWFALAGNHVGNVLIENPTVGSSSAHWAVVLGLLTATLVVSAGAVFVDACVEALSD